MAAKRQICSRVLAVSLTVGTVLVAGRSVPAMGMVGGSHGSQGYLGVDIRDVNEDQLSV